ncbi:MAG: DUF2508 family protein [Clostridiales bacterium]
MISLMSQMERLKEGAKAKFRVSVDSEAGSGIEKNKDVVDLLDIYTLTQQARTGWEEAWRFFHQAVEPDMVDNAIFTLNAAEKRYDYFIKLAKEKNLRNGGTPYDG